MKIKNSTFEKQKAIEEFSKFDLPPLESLKAIRNIKALGSAGKDYFDAKNKLIEKHGEVDPKTKVKGLNPGSKNWEAFFKDWTELMSGTTEVKIDVMTISENYPSMKASMLQDLDFMFGLQEEEVKPKEAKK